MSNLKGLYNVIRPEEYNWPYLFTISFVMVYDQNF